jgi:hypothetical protein
MSVNHYKKLLKLSLSIHNLFLKRNFDNERWSMSLAERGFR